MFAPQFRMLVMYIIVNTTNLPFGNDAVKLWWLPAGYARMKSSMQSATLLAYNDLH